MNREIMNHQVGEFVAYKKHGVYQIADIKREKICGVLENYFVLRSVYDKNSTVYVPAGRADLVAQMEHILTKEEIDNIISSSADAEIEWVSVTAERASFFEEIIHSEDLVRIISMMRLLSAKKEEAVRTKAKTFAHDERMLNAAQRTVAEAFAFSLGIDKKDVTDYINQKLSD